MASCVSLNDELSKIVGLPEGARKGLLDLYLQRCDLAASRGFVCSMRDFINEVKEGLRHAA